MVRLEEAKPKPVRVAALQLPIRMDVVANLDDLESAVSTLQPHTIAVAPEGCLSGYLPEPGFVARLDDEVTAQAIERAREMAVRAGIHLVVGACLRVEGAWRNAAFYMSPERQLWRYDKINLAQSERGDFTPGNELPVFDLVVDGDLVRLGVQMCREIRYPEQWRWLAMQGAQVIAYVNNAVGSAHGHDLWRAHAISRAAEIQRFVVGANNAAPDQTCTTLVVAPSGKVIAEAPEGEMSMARATIDLAEVSDWVIRQARGDIVAVVGPESAQPST